MHVEAIKAKYNFKQYACCHLEKPGFIMRLSSLLILLAGLGMIGVPEESFASSSAQKDTSAFDQTIREWSAGDPLVRRETVDYPTDASAGTIFVSTVERRLYLVLGDGKAMRYGIGVAREGFEWAGTMRISMKREWPDWTPPAEMLRRRPELPRHMAGGPDNPLGARAMYLGSSLYRIHGSNEPETIGEAVSSGCIRMANEDVIDLYERVKIGTVVVVQK